MACLLTPGQFGVNGGTVNQRAGKRSRTRRWLVRYPRAMPLGIFALIAAVTVLSIFAIERGEAQRERAQLQSRTVAIASALERRSNASSAYLRAGAALLASLDTIKVAKFRRFVSELRLDADYRGAEGIGWAMVVRPDQVAGFNQLMQLTAPEPVTLHPQPRPSQPYSVPVTFLQPDTQRNRLALGYDMFSDPVRRAAMMEAERTARPTASGKVVLKQEGKGTDPGFIIYMPVFETTPTGRRLKGFIFSPFNAQNFLSSALQLEDAGNYGVRLYDGSVSPRNLMAETQTIPNGKRDVHAQLISIANSPFVLEVSRARHRGLTGLSVATLIFGMLVASLLMLLVRMLTQQTIEDEASLVWFQEQASIRNSLTRELNHRVKNTLANVLSIIALTRRRAQDVDDFADSLDGRIRALSATHDLLTMSDWGTTPIRAVVEAELLPYARASDYQVDIAGPDIELAPNDALSLGLAMHELATNATKYGALSQPGGKVSVRWRLITETQVRIDWRESDGPPVPEERGRGFGTDLIERVVAHELRNPVQLDFNPDGVHCVLQIPVRRPSEFAMRASRTRAERAEADKT